MSRHFQEKRNRSHESVRIRDIYSQKSLVEICSDSDWAADRETRQSVSCGAIFVNGNMVHFQSKRQRSVSLSSCESETIAAVSIMSEGIFLQKLIARITGIEPEIRLYIDSSSSRQLISRKGLGKVRHLDVSLLWIQKMKNVLVKAIKGVDNPADLGTKALSRDKIRKYLRTLGYKGDFLDEEEHQVRRMRKGMKTVSVSMIAKIVAVLMSEGICVEGAIAAKGQSPCHGLSIMSCCLICIVVCCMLSMFIPAAIWDQAFSFGKEEKKGKEKLGGKKRKREEMADERDMPQEMAAEPTPTEEGEETMEKRAQELKKKAIDAKAARQMALEKAEQEKALEDERAAEEKENPTGSGALQPEAAVQSGSTVEKTDENEESEEDSEKSESSEEEQSSSDDEEEENPTGSGKQQSVILSDVPAVEEAVITHSDVPAVEEAKQQTQDEESKEEKKERLSREMDTYFKGVLRTLAAKIEGNKQYSATRTVLALYGALTASFATPSDLQEDDLRDSLLLAELNRETLNTLYAQCDRTDRYRTLLRAKAQALEAERQRKNEEITRKLGWIEQKMTEVRAEENALRKMSEFHESIETYVATGLRELRNLQKSEDAVEMQWSGLDYEMSREGGEKLIGLTFYEKLFSERMNPSESSPLVELETSLKSFENVTIDLEKDPAAPAVTGKMGPPEVPIKREPKTKPMPRPLNKEEAEKQRDEKMLQEKKEKKKREVEEIAASTATASTEDAAKRQRKEITSPEMMRELTNAERVPTEYLDVEVSQAVWNLMGKNSRERALAEQRAAEGQKCFFCGGPHRAFMCGDMLQLACAFGRLAKQPQFGGTDRRHSLWCSSCAYANGKKAYETGEDPRKTSGWFGHTRSACHAKDRCPLDSDEKMLRMSAKELLRHLTEKGMYGEKEKELQEKETEKFAMRRKSEARSVTASEVESQEPEKKRQKKERKDQERRIREEKAAEKKAEEDRLRKQKEEEEERIRKETEDRKTRLRESSNEILHGYLFDKDFRVTTQKAQEAQAKYERKLEYSILEQTPNYQSRLQETNEYNKRQIEEHNARMLREKKERILKEEEEKEKERLKRRAERKAAKKIMKDIEKGDKAEKKEKKQKKEKA